MCEHASTAPLTTARIHLGRLARNLALLQELAGERPMWPAIKANAYGHGASIVARHLVARGYDTLCVAQVSEAVELLEAGIAARFLILSPAQPDQAPAIVRHRLKPSVCSLETVEAIAGAAEPAQPVDVHLNVDTGMGRVGVRPEEAAAFLDRCAQLPGVRVKGVMSHFPRADEADKTYSLAQIERFRAVAEATRERGIAYYHLANSAGILDLPESRFDAVRPGIALYGIPPSAQLANPRAAELEPVLELECPITFLKEVPAGIGLSYGHTFLTERPSLIATIPVGYGDGLRRGLSNRMDVLVHGVRCPQVGTITMDQSLVDVTALRGRVRPGDPAVIIGRQGGQTLRAVDMAARLDTIAYEIVTGFTARVRRMAVND